MQFSIASILEKAKAGETLSTAEGYQLIHGAEAELPILLSAASALRDRHKGRTVTYSRKVFLPITNLCRDRCSYCTFRKDPRDPGAWSMAEVSKCFAIGTIDQLGFVA